MCSHFHFPEAAMGISMHDSEHDHSEYTHAVKR
jgi:hypothetical protein